MALHAGPGCFRDDTALYAGVGKVDLSCDSTESGQTAGCSVTDPGYSFGPKFNQAGGGVWAVEWSSRGLFVWRWGRSNVPVDVLEEKPDPASWGLPVAAWPSATCSALLAFRPMRIIL